MQHGGGSVTRKREWSDANDTVTSGYHRSASRGGTGGGSTGQNEGEVIEKEMKRLRLAKDERRRWPGAGGGDVDVDMDGGSGSGSGDWQLAVTSPRIDYRPINTTLRECHYLRQLRRFQSERVSYLERRAPTDAAAAAIMHAMQGRRR